jgi:2Fe-2S ferredoxin
MAGPKDRAAMARIEFVMLTGATRSVEAQAGFTLMEVAVQNCIDGIKAECGGACACATCHVYLDAATCAKVPQPAGYEATLLEGLEHARAGSRLACQIEVSDMPDGALVTVAIQA